MNKQIKFSILCAALLAGLCQLSTAAKKAEPLTPAGEKLLAEYTATLETLKKEITAAAPKLDEAKSNAYFA